MEYVNTHLDDFEDESKVNVLKIIHTPKLTKI